MTEEQIKKWLETHEPTMDDITQLVAEARGKGRTEGIGEMVEAVFLELGGDVDKEFLEGIAAERLREKTKEVAHNSMWGGGPKDGG